MALTIATLLQKTTMIVGDTLLPETTHAALTIALECDDLLAFSKCQKTFVASAVGGVYAAKNRLPATFLSCRTISLA